MLIRTREEAKLMVEEVAKYLRKAEEERKNLQHHDDAAEWATELLDASGRDGLGGCPLCRS